MKLQLTLCLSCVFPATFSSLALLFHLSDWREAAVWFVNKLKLSSAVNCVALIQFASFTWSLPTKPPLQMHEFPHISYLALSFQSFRARLKVSFCAFLIPINSARHCLCLLRFTADPGAAAAAYFVLNSTTKSSAHKKHLISSPPAFLLIHLDKYWRMGLQLQPSIHEERFGF